MQPHLNTMMSRVRQDRNFITTELAEAAVTDSFTKRLLGVYAASAAYTGDQASTALRVFYYYLKFTSVTRTECAQGMVGKPPFRTLLWDWFWKPLPPPFSNSPPSICQVLLLMMACAHVCANPWPINPCPSTVVHVDSPV